MSRLIIALFLALASLVAGRTDSHRDTRVSPTDTHVPPTVAPSATSEPPPDRQPTDPPPTRLPTQQTVTVWCENMVCVTVTPEPSATLAPPPTDTPAAYP